MKQFDKEKAKRNIKIKQNKDTYIKKLSISLSCLILVCVIILFTFAKFETSSEEYTMINGKLKYRSCEYDSGKTWTFDYTGDKQTFAVPCNGTYKLEVWGAAGDSTVQNYGYGGYAVGVYNASVDSVLNIVVGQKAKKTIGGYNGGGTAGGVVYGGGGATHIALDSGLLQDLYAHATDGRILIVAGGGGGAWNYSGLGAGSGGGYLGTSGYGNGTSYGSGGSQTAGGSSSYPGSFGKGGEWSGNQAGGGGGGYYGGGCGYRGGNLSGAGGGGSGYIASTNLISTTGITKHMACYNCTGSYSSADVNTKTINASGVSSYPVSDYAKSGDGYAKITYLGGCQKNAEYTFEYTGDVQTFTPFCEGTYKIEAWGAQGGTYSTNIGGYGGYSVGDVTLTDTDHLYIAVGEKGKANTGSGTISAAQAFNGGGNANSSSPVLGGGGATSIYLNENNGELKNYSSSQSNILMVAGGGGGGHAAITNTVVGSGGGYIGVSGQLSTGSCSCSYSGAGGGTQSSGGASSTCGNRTYGTNGTFGLAGITTSSTNGGGGGGYYGGGYQMCGSGAGGSGYIGNTNLINKSMYCYNCSESTAVATYTVSTTGTSSLRDTTNCPNGFSNDPVSKCAKEGNGYVKITFIPID